MSSINACSYSYTHFSLGNCCWSQDSLFLFPEQATISDPCSRCRPLRTSLCRPPPSGGRITTSSIWAFRAPTRQCHASFTTMHQHEPDLDILPLLFFIKPRRHIKHNSSGAKFVASFWPRRASGSCRSTCRTPSRSPGPSHRGATAYLSELPPS